MITAVDTSVLLDVFLPDARHGPQSVQRLRDAYDRGAILVCDVVYAELVPAFDDRTALDGVLREIGGTPSPYRHSPHRTGPSPRGCAYVEGSA